MPIAVISGASRGALRSGRYATFSITKFSTEQTTIAHMQRDEQQQPARHARHGPSQPVTDQLVSAPTISTSPCAKLIRLMMPYTIV